MPNTLPNREPATERKTLADVCGKPIKADLRPQVAASELRTVAKDTVHRVSSQKAAASDIGLSESRLSHKFEDGTVTLRELETLGPVYAAELGKQLIEKYGPLADPKERARQQIREARRVLDELAEYVEWAS